LCASDLKLFKVRELGQRRRGYDRTIQARCPAE
jgi:hypothetical protein